MMIKKKTLSVHNLLSTDHSKIHSVDRRLLTVDFSNNHRLGGRVAVVRIAFVLMMLFRCLPNKHGCKIRKNKGLNKRHQHFDYINKYRERDGNRRKTNADAFT